ncbi:MAG: DJ-1 family protein [Gammaproteobacteria bacterium]|nr:MAG: DJ-1 family protein [Gammaproteobacteria bacterium]
MRNLLFLIDGFEEIEALTTIDILRRANIEVQTVSLTDSKVVIGGHNVPIAADILFEQADFSDVNTLIIPGGTAAFDEHSGLKQQIQAHAQAGKPVAAICAAPMVLGGLGLLQGKKATCYPGFEKYLAGAEIQAQAAVVVDGNITTGRGPAFATVFALQLVENLAGKAKREEISQQLLLS